MKCLLCSNQAEIKCSCSTPYLCSSHLGPHLLSTDPHPYERLSIFLTPHQSQTLKFELFTRLSQIKALKNRLSSLSASLIRTLKDLSKASQQKLDKLSEIYLPLLNRERFSESEKVQIEKLNETKLKVAKLNNVCIEKDLEKVFKQEFFKEIPACEWKKKQFLKSHSGGFKCGVITEDQLKLVTGSEDCIVRVWDLCQGKNLMVLKGHTSFVWCIDLAPGSVVAASGSLDGTVRIWNLELGIKIALLLGHSGPVLCVQFVNKEKVVSAGFACEIIFWNCNHENSLQEKIKTKAPSFSLILKKNKLDVFCGSGKDICLYSITCSKFLKSLKGHKQAVKCLALSDSEDILVSGSNDKTIIIWGMKTYSLLFTLHGHIGSINSICLAKNNEKIISASEDSTIRIWSIQSKSQISQYSSHLSSIYKLIPHNENFIALSHEASISTLDLSNYSLHKRYLLKPWIVKSESLSTDKSFLYYSSGTSACKYNLQKCSLDSELIFENTFVSCISVSNNQKFAVVGLRSQKENLILWDLQKNTKSKIFLGHSKSVFCVQIKNQEEIFASGSADKTVRIWNISNENFTMVLEGHSDKVNTVKFTNKNFFLVSAGKDKKIIVWDLRSASMFFVFCGHNQIIWNLELSCDDEFIVSADSYEGVRVWSLEGKRQEYHFSRFFDAENWLKNHNIEVEQFRRYLMF